MHRLGIESTEDLVGDDADPFVAFEDGMTGDGGIEEAVYLNRAVQIGIVVCLLRGVARRIPAFK